MGQQGLDSYEGGAKAARRRPGRPRKDADCLSSVQQERLATLEMLALWGGQVRRRDLMRAFDLSDGQVTQTIGLYRRLAPSNLEVDPDTRAWRPSSRFSPQFIRGETSEYLRKVLASKIAEIGGIAVGCDVPTAILPTIPANFPRDTVSLVVSSILAERGLQVLYQSLDTAEPISRTIWPHALVYTGYRWLIRCFDGRHDRFADMALARILSAVSVDTACHSSPSYDDSWTTILTLRLRPVSHLSTSQQEMVRREYGFQSGDELCVEVRASMLQYFLDFYGMRPGDRGKNIMLEISNFCDISSYDRVSLNES